MKNIILLGSPGSGKGTQAENITRWYGIPQVSTGEIFRSNIKAGTEIGLTVKGYIDAGQLVPDEVTVDLVKSRLAEGDCADGFVLDGFPRSVAQAETLDGFLTAEGRAIQAVLSIYVPDETIVQRMSGRRMCPNCGKTYHIEYKPPAPDDACLDCGTGVVQRDDDKEETVRNRLSVYYAQTAPLIERYSQAGIFTQITGRELVEDTTNEMAAALKSIFGE